MLQTIRDHYADIDTNGDGTITSAELAAAANNPKLPQNVRDACKQLFNDDDPWSERIFLSELRHANNHYFGAYTDDDTLVGYAGLAVNGRAPDFETEVHTIGVDTAWQCKGIGKGLLRAMLRIADRHKAPVFLEVRTDNLRAQQLYERHEFTRVGIRKGYYQPSGADALVMRRCLRGGTGEQE